MLKNVALTAFVFVFMHFFFVPDSLIIGGLVRSEVEGLSSIIGGVEYDYPDEGYISDAHRVSLAKFISAIDYGRDCRVSFFGGVACANLLLKVE